MASWIPPEDNARHRLLAIFAADAAGFARLMSIDDRGTVAALDAARLDFREQIESHGGRVVDMAGDSVLAVFDTAIGAVKAALESQRLSQLRENAAPDLQRMLFRIGIHLGEVIEKSDGSVYGDGVNIAARLQALAEPGGIAVSQSVEGAINHRVEARFIDLGEQQVKNIGRAVRAFRCEPQPGPLVGTARIDGVGPPPADGRTTRVSMPVSRALWRKSIVYTLMVVCLGGFAWASARYFLPPAAVIPYSTQDRRMTFAVLPFRAPEGDEAAAQIARAFGDAVLADMENNTVWTHTVSRAIVDRAVARHVALKDVASDLDVHFLVRGAVNRLGADYSVDIAVVDAETERVLDTRTLPVATNARTPRGRGEIRNTMAILVLGGLTTEVERARHKPDQQLDVRDLTFRAFVDWRDRPGARDPKATHLAVSALLDRALALKPDDPLALFVIARINLCDCVHGWSKNVAEQEAVGVAAMEKYLEHDPTSTPMLLLKSDLYQLHGRYEEALLVAEDVLRRDPYQNRALASKTGSLLSLDRTQEAADTLQILLAHQDPGLSFDLLTAIVRFRLGDFDAAARSARKATTGLTHEELAHPNTGVASLWLIAAEARLGHAAKAHAAFQEFTAAVPKASSIAAIKTWMSPPGEFDGAEEAMFAALKLAGVPE